MIEENALSISLSKLIETEIKGRMEARNDYLLGIKTELNVLMEEVKSLSTQIQVSKQHEEEFRKKHPFPKLTDDNEEIRNACTSTIDKDHRIDGKLLFAKNLPRVAKIDAREEEQKQLKQQKERQELFDRAHVKYPECRTTVFEPTEYACLSQEDWIEKNSIPSTTLQTEFIHGYHNTYYHESATTGTFAPHGNDNPFACSTNNVFSLCSGEIIYYTSGVVIMYQKSSGTQRFFKSPQASTKGSAEFSSLAVHPAGRLVATGQAGRNCSIYVWDSFASKTVHHAGSLPNPTILTTLHGHTITVRCLDFSHDGKLLVSLGGDPYNTINIWEWRSGTMLATTRGHSSLVYTVAFNPYQAMGIPDDDEPKPGQALLSDDACYTLVSCGARHIRFWVLHRVSQPRDQNQEKEESAFFGSTFGSPTKMRATPKYERVWKLDGNHPLMGGKGEMQDFTCITFVNDSKPLYIFDEESQKLRKLKGSNDHTLGRIVAGTASGDIYIFWQPRKPLYADNNQANEQVTRWWESPDEFAEFEQFLWEPHGRLLFMVPHDIATGNRFKLSKAQQNELREIEASLKTNPKSKRLCARRYEIEYHGELAHSGAVVRLCFNQSTKSIISSGVDGTIKVWQLSMYKTPAVPGIYTLGNYFPLDREIYDGEHEIIRVFTKDHQAVEYKFSEGIGIVRPTFIRSLSFSVDNIILMGTNKNNIYTMELGYNDTGIALLQPVKVVESHYAPVINAEVHPSLDVFATVSEDRTFRLWSTSSRSCIGCIETPAKGTCIAFHPLGHICIVGTVNGEILVIDTSQITLSIAILTQKGVRTNSNANDTNSKHKRPGGSRSITCAKFSPNGSFLALGSRDNSVYLMDADRNFKRLVTCCGHSSFITQLDWSSDSSTIQTNAADGEILYWAIPAGKQITDTINIRDTKWDRWTCTLGWPVQGIWQSESNRYNSLIDIASLCKTNGTRSNGQSYECVVTADLNVVRLYKWPCLKSAKCKTYGGHASLVQCVRFSCFDSHVISVGGNDCSVFQWRLNDKNGETIRLTTEELRQLERSNDNDTNNVKELKRRNTSKASLQVCIDPKPPESPTYYNTSPLSRHHSRKTTPSAERN